MLACDSGIALKSQHPLSSPERKQTSAYYAAALMGEAVGLIKKAFPKADITSGYFADPRAGWIGTDGKTVVNLSSSRLDAPFHEAGHLWLAVIKASDPALYESLLDMAEDSYELKKVKALNPELSHRSQLEETFVTILGKEAASQLQSMQQQSFIDRFYNAIREALEAVSGRIFNFKLKKSPLSKILPEMASRLISGEEISSITSDELSRIVDEVKNLKTTSVGSFSELLERLSGKTLGTSKAVLASRADAVLASPKNSGDSFHYNGVDVFYGTKDPAARRAKVMSHIEASIYSSNEENRKAVLSFYSKTKKERAALLTSGTEAEQAYHMAISKLFPNFKEGDKVEVYSDKLGDIYDKTLDNGRILVRTGEREIGGKKEKVYDVAALSDESLNRSSKAEPLLKNIASGFAARKGFGITLSSDPVDLHKLSAVMIAAGIVSAGGRVDSISVGKLTNGQPSQVQGVIPTEYLLNIERLYKQGLIREMVQGSHLEKVLSTDGVFDAKKYVYDYHALLEDYYQENAKDYSQQSVLSKLRDYDAKPSIKGSKELKRAYLKRMNELKKHYAADVEHLYENEEFLLLSQSLYFLENGAGDVVNLPKDMGSIEKWYTTLRGLNNPYVNWVLREWDNRRYEQTEKYMAYKEKINPSFDALVKDYNLRNTLSAATDVAAANESKFYEPLFVYEELPYTDPKTLEVKKIKVNTFRFVATGSPEWKSLSKEQQGFISAVKAHIKTTIISSLEKRYQSDPSMTMAQIEAQYEKEWGDGKLPLVSASSVSQLMRGDVKEGTKTAFERLLTSNPYYDQADNKYETLSDAYIRQGGEGAYGDSFRRSLLGIEVDDKSGSASIIDPSLAKDIESDLRKTLDIFTMSLYKKEFLEETLTIWKGATALIRAREKRKEGFTRGEKTNDEEVMDRMIKALVLNERQAPAKSSGVKLANKVASAASTITTYGAIALSPLNDLTNFATQFLSLLTRATANLGTDQFDISDVLWAMKQLKSPRKLYELGIHLRVLNTDEFDLIRDPKNMLSGKGSSGRQTRLLEWQNTLIGNRIGDSTVKLMIMAMQMKKQGIWSAYDYNAKDELVYDPSKDLRPASVKNLVRDNLVKEGILEEGQPLDRAYDGNLRRSLERIVSTVAGGYTDGTMSALQTEGWGQAFKNFRTYMLIRLERTFKGESFNENQVSYVDDKGEAKVITAYEVGLYNSFVKMVALTYHYKGNALSSYKQMRPEERHNLMQITYGLMMSFMLMGLRYAFEDDDPAAKKTLSIYDKVIMDMFVVDNAKSMLGFVKNPFVALEFTWKLADATFDLVTGNMEGARGTAFKTIGVLKTYDLFFPESDPR